MRTGVCSARVDESVDDRGNGGPTRKIKNPQSLAVKGFGVELAKGLEPSTY